MYITESANLPTLYLSMGSSFQMNLSEPPIVLSLTFKNRIGIRTYVKRRNLRSSRATFLHYRLPLLLLF